MIEEVKFSFQKVAISTKYSIIHNGFKQKLLSPNA